MSETAKKPLDTAATVEALAGYGSPVEEIAILLGMSADDVEAQYADALAAGPAKARQKVRQALYNMAISGKNYQATAAWLEEHGDAADGVEMPTPKPKAADPVTGLGEIALLAVRARKPK